jgi:hypothetical protein
MKRKEKELKTALSRLEQLQTKNELLERANVVLQADRKSFRSLAQRLKADITAFEAATAKDEPVDLDELLISIDFVDYKAILLQMYTELFGECLCLPTDAAEILAVVYAVIANRKQAEHDQVAKLHAQFDRKTQEISELSVLLELAKTECAEARQLVATKDAIITATAEDHAKELVASGREIRNSRAEILRLDAEHEAKSEQYTNMILLQESEIARLQSEFSRQKPLHDLNLIAGRQAERDHEISALRQDIARLTQTNKQTGYLKSVLIKWLVFVKDGDIKRHAVLPVLDQLLGLDDVEKRVMHSF